MSPLPFFRRRQRVERPPDEPREYVARPGEEEYVELPEDEAATEYIARPEDEPTEYVGPPVAEEFTEYDPPPSERRVTRVTEEPPQRVVPPERNPWPWLLALLFLVLGGIAAAYFLTREDDSASTDTVPNVVGRRANAATARLRADGFTPVTRQQYSDEARGVVLRQEPPAGRTLREGGTVTLFASRGPATATVPNLRGLSEAEAARELTERGLRANVFRVPSDEPDGTVVAQNPAADEVVKKGSAVRMNVSRGQTTTTTETTTTTTTTTTTPTTTGATGATPPAPQAVDVPDVVGQTEADAAAALADVGLLADSYPVAAQDPSGTVVAQRPAAGGTAEAGLAVRLNISIGTGARPEKAVPDVTGVTDRVARGRLRRVGLTVRAIPRTVTKPDQNGVVILQAPNAGLRLQLRAQVTIYVGRLRP